MSRLIDEQAAIDAICSACNMVSDYHKCDWYPENSKYQLCEEINSLRRLSSAVVKCKDCKYLWKSDDESLWCNRLTGTFKVEEEGYCSWGKI